MSKRSTSFLSCLAFTVGIGISSNANAWFFFFIPGSVTQAVGDAITGAKGNICVKDGTETGHTITSSSGNTGRVISTSGKSSMCRSPALPIRAEVEFTFNYIPNVGIELTDDFQPSTLTELDRFNGFLMKATSKTVKLHGIHLLASAKKPNVDIITMANTIEHSLLNSPNLKNTTSQNAETLVINDRQAVRFEVKGTTNSVFGQDITYLYTIIEGDNERVIVSVFSPTNYIAEHRAEMMLVALQVQWPKPISNAPVSAEAEPASVSDTKPPPAQPPQPAP